mmetsp:Transcript_17561/g.38708  ORF Transcript_17561/g.38708 Transcript_17561/m.38708 type:complete len:216 (+) Transcript_17561:223-870(+)
MATDGPANSRPSLEMLQSMANLLANCSKSSWKLSGQVDASCGSSRVSKVAGSTSMSAWFLKCSPKVSATASSLANPSRLCPSMAVMVQPAVRCGCPGFSSTRSTCIPQQVGVSSTPAPRSGSTRRYGFSGSDLPLPLPLPFSPLPLPLGSSTSGAFSSIFSGSGGGGDGSSSSSLRWRPAYFGPVFNSPAQLFPLGFFFGFSTSSAFSAALGAGA